MQILVKIQTESVSIFGTTKIDIKMSKIKQQRIPVEVVKTKSLVRQSDGLTKQGRIKFVEWNEDGTWKEIHDEMKVGYSCIVNPRISYTWLTSVITEVISETEFKTENSHYKII